MFNRFEVLLKFLLGDVLHVKTECSAFSSVFVSVDFACSESDASADFSAVLLPSAAVISVFVGMVTIVALFYTYKGVLGYSIDAVNIIIYYIGLAVMLAVKNMIINSEILAGKNFAIIFLSKSLDALIFCGVVGAVG